MNRIVNLITATALCALLCACAGGDLLAQQTPAKPTIVVQPPRGEPGDFVLCNDGRVLVFAASHPKSCS